MAPGRFPLGYRTERIMVTDYSVVEICAGAGGQALGLDRANFQHALAVELDRYACETLRANRDWKVAEGDVADGNVWDPREYEGVPLLAGGVPCPPFSIAGKQLGASDERDLFAWAVELAGIVKPRALLLENVRGLSTPRFGAYRQRILDRLAELDYVGDWRLLHASDFGVPQLRPRFVLVALRREDAPYFFWPEQTPTGGTVGTALSDLMGAKNWQYLDAWVQMADDIAPTLVGGSKKHGGPDLGPTRAKRAWRGLGVDGLGIANDGDVPLRRARHPRKWQPKLTIEMVARLQGWDDCEWKFLGGKTARYRQIGNAFPPPVAEAVGKSIMKALNHEGKPHDLPELAEPSVHDGVYRVLREADDFVTPDFIVTRSEEILDLAAIERRVAHLSRDFIVEIQMTPNGYAYKLGAFKGFVGQEDHDRHGFLTNHRSRVS
jgi:DNA (cytosine-5)-methyltransferase 1